MEKESATYRGKVSFINYEKFFATIEYQQGAKQKSVNCKINADDINKKPHQFRLGDVVSFQLRLSDRGDKMTAYNVKYLHNEAIDLLIQKSALENRFSGYLKKVDDKYFVKELNSYILFPLKLSPWEMPPAQAAENVAIAFSLANLDKPNALVAELFSHSFIPEYKMAWQHFINEIDADARVMRISPHAVYLGLFDNKIQAKLSLKDAGNDQLKEGDIIPVKITHLSEDKIAVKRLGSQPEEPVVQQ